MKTRYSSREENQLLGLDVEPKDVAYIIIEIH